MFPGNQDLFIHRNHLATWHLVQDKTSLLSHRTSTTTSKEHPKNKQEASALSHQRIAEDKHRNIKLQEIALQFPCQIYTIES